MSGAREHLADWVPIAWDDPESDYDPLRWRCRICGDITDDRDVIERLGLSDPSATVTT